jgi:hypothetical protein
MGLGSCPTYIFDDAAFEVIKVLVFDKVPDLDPTFLVVRRVVLSVHLASV